MVTVIVTKKLRGKWTFFMRRSGSALVGKSIFSVFIHNYRYGAGEGIT
jgi:hypothetical protein